MGSIQNQILDAKLLQEGDFFAEKEKVLKVLEVLYTARLMDDKMSKLVRQNKGTSFFLSTAGHEMVGAIAAEIMEPGKDWAFPYYRDRAFALGYGCPRVEILAAFLARDIPHHSGGRMMLDHFSDKGRRIPCQSSVVGSQFLQAVGTALSVKLRKESEAVYVSAGEGATSQGDFHEALNFASIHQLPVIFVIQDNNYAISVTVKEQTAGGSIVHMARGYEGLSVHDVDGTDFEQTASAMQKAYQKAKAQKGPSLIVAKVPRLNSHTSSDDQKKYKPDSLIKEEAKRDPIVLFEKWILAKGYAEIEDFDLMKQTIYKNIEDDALTADTIPFPKKATATEKVFMQSEDLPLPKEVKTSDEMVTMMDALNHAFVEEMERDPHVIVFGLDVANAKGGVFGITRNLTEKFGKERCFNTPLAESTIIGVAMGVSFDGKHKPVVEIQFADYAWTGMNQIVNELSSIYYRSNGEWNCPVVVRLPYGGYIQGGPYHSQSIEAHLVHTPGLKVVVPSNAMDAKMLMKTAIRDPNPVIFLEHKAIYRQLFFCSRNEPLKDELLPFGRANIVSTGTDATVVCWGMMVMMAYEVASDLKKEGMSVEVIDLRTLVPLDMETILLSLKKTGKLLILHEASKSCGFGAELAARSMEEGFMDLDAPIVRVTGKDCPIPFCKDLEDEVLPQKNDLKEAIKKLVNY